MVRASGRAKHTDEPSVGDGHILSGGRSCDIAYADEVYAAGRADDGSVWVLLREPALRPRGHAPDVVVRSAAEVVYEPNGLVRVLDRRTDRGMIERLVDELANRRTAHKPSVATAAVRPGDYKGVRVTEADGYLLVEAEEAFERRLKRCGAIRRRDGRWKVQRSEAGQLRREIVEHLTAPRHRARLWIAVHARGVALALVALLCAATLLDQRLVYLLPPALAVLAFAVFAHPGMIARARERWLGPHLELTAPEAAEVRRGSSGTP